MNTTADEALDALEARIMDNSHDRWYVTSRSEGELNVETCVSNPGWENCWVLIWVSPDKARIEMLSNNPEGGHWIEGAYEMSVNDLLQYLHSLPRPIKSFGATEIESARGHEA